MWKESVVASQDRATLVARGFVGPARWLKTPRSVEHAANTLRKSPGVFRGVTQDYSTSDTLTDFEIESIKGVCEGNREEAMMAAAEVAQRVNDMPKVDNLVQQIVREAEPVLREVPRKALGQTVGQTNKTAIAVLT